MIKSRANPFSSRQDDTMSSVSSKTAVSRTKRSGTVGSAFESVLVDISAKFIGLPPDRLDGEVVDALRRVCESLGFDACVLWQSSPERPELWSSSPVSIGPELTLA